MATKIGSLFGDVSLRTAKLDKDIAGVGKKLNRLGKGMSSLGKDMSMKLTAPIAAVGVASLKTFADFEKGMREVKSLLPNLNNGEFVELQKDVRELSVEMGINAVEATGALYQAISAGVPKDNAIEFLRVSSKAAIAGLTNTETSVDTLTSVLNAYKRPAEDAEAVSDVLFTTVRLGKTNFEELGASIFNVAPIASAMNVSLEEVGASVATLTKQGVPTAQAMTQLRGALVALQKPNKEMQEALSGMGYESGQALLDAQGLHGALNALREESGLTSSQLTAAFGRVEAFGAVLALTGKNTKGALEDLEAMGNASGAMEAAFEVNDEGAMRDWEKFMGIMRELAIELGQNLAPIITDMAEDFKEWYDDNEENLPQWIELATKIGLVVGALGPLLLGMGTLISLTSKSIFWVGALGIGLGVLIDKMGFMKEAGGALGQLLIDMWSGDVIASIGSYIGMLAEVVELFTGPLGITFSAEKIREDVIAAFDAISNAVANLIVKVQELINKLSEVNLSDINPLQGVGEGLGNAVGDLLFRADGGPVSSGSPYIVGERGPELFVPSYSGTIVPNEAMGGGGQTINMTFNGVGMEMQAWLKNNRGQLARIAVDAVSENNLRTT